MEATERLWLTEDRSELVPDGDPRAAFLFCIPGQRLTDEDAQKYGLADDGEAKKRKPAENKQADVQEDK